MDKKSGTDFELILAVVGRDLDCRFSRPPARGGALDSS